MQHNYKSKKDEVEASGDEAVRIAVFIEYFPPRLGSDRRIYEIMKRISDKHEVQFIVIPPFRMLSGTLSLAKGNLSLHFQDKEKVAMCDGIIGRFIHIPHVILKLWKSSYTVAYFLTLALLFPRVIRSIRKFDPEVIVLNYPSVYTGVLGFVVGKLLRKFIVLDFSDLIAQYTIHFLNLKKSSFKARLLIFIQNIIVKKSSRIVAPTSFIRNYTLVLKVNDKKIIVIPNGVDTQFFDPNNYDGKCIKSKFNLSDTKICVYCGRLDSWAGIDTLMALCRTFNRENSNIKLVVVGSGAKKSEVLKDVVMMGEVSYENVPKILAATDLILVPFPCNEVSHAASPLKLFEGMAMQKPVIASKVSGIREIITQGENGILVDPDDVDKWFETILFLLNSKSSARRMGENARRTAKEKYDWSLLAKRYEKVLAKSG